MLLLHGSFAQTTYEAEDAYFYHGIVEDEHAGFSGTGYVNGDNEVGSFIEWVVSMADAGTQTVTITYANGTTQDRMMEISLNGQVIDADLSFTGTGAFTTYGTQTIDLPLVAGKNLVRATAVTANGGPNIDNMIVPGTAGPDFYKLTTSVLGEGSVSSSESDSIFEAGTEVTLTAQPDAGYAFARWTGAKASSDASLTVNMDSAISLNAIFLRDGLDVEPNQQIGWVTVDGCITGGTGGTVVTVDNQSDLENYLNRSDAYIIQVQGTIQVTPFGKEMSVGSNTTLIGLGTDATIRGGGLSVQGVSNVVIRNLTLTDAFVDFDGKTTDNDAIEINNSSYVWVDHCDFSYFDDGLIDIKTGADFVTVSWCRFHNHNKVMLIGAGDDVPEDVGHLNVTVHHNWFDGQGGIGLHQRVPRVRYGKVHVYNNFYDYVQIRGPLAGYDADLRLENNYFKDTNDPHPVQGGAGGGDNKLAADGNIYDNSGSRRDERSASQVFVPDSFYTYSLHDADDVPTVVTIFAGILDDPNIDWADITCEASSTSIRDKAQAAFSLQTIPNPFGEQVTIRYELPESADVQLTLLDLTGRKIMTLVDGMRAVGGHEVAVKGAELAPGIYVCQLTVSGQVETLLMVKGE